MTKYKAACYKLRWDIADAKQHYGDKMDALFKKKDTQGIWQGLHEVTDYKGARPCLVSVDKTLENKLNSFNPRFEASSANAGHANAGLTNADRKSSSNEATLNPVLSEHDVRRELKRVNTRKAAGPDRISGRVIRTCADLLAPVFTTIFNLSLAQSTVPTCFKMSTIIPVPKNASPAGMNDYRPIALTSVVMKCFERLVKDHICSSLQGTLDPLQFAYRSNRSTGDAIS